MSNLEESVIAALKQRISNGNEIIDEKGYFRSSDPKDNLLDKNLPDWDEISDELKKGAGNELRSHFCAVHSSSALCVNNFAPFKNAKASFEFLGHSNFHKATFEAKQPTGLPGTPPHLDFHLENADTIIGFESKLTEYFTKKLPNHDNNLKTYSESCPDKLKYLPKGFREKIIDYNITYPYSTYLDIAQLIKHTIGLLNNKHENKNIKEAILVYIYWEPINSDKFEICRTHKKEIDCFKSRIEEFISFKSMSYIDFWGKFEGNPLFKDNISKMKERYYFALE